VEIHPVEVTANAGKVRARSRIVNGSGEQDLWFELDEAYAPYLVRDRLDAFLVALLQRAMRDGEDIVVRGPVSEKLLYNLRSYYLPILTQQRPKLRAVRILAEGIPAAAPDLFARGVATGFTAGIDSLCTVADHHFSEVAPRFRLTHLLFSNTGSHGYLDHDRARRLFQARYAHVQRCAHEIGLDVIRVDSNLSELLRMSFQESDVPRNIAPVLLLQDLIGTYYYAASFRYRDCYIGKTYDLAYADPAAVHLLSTDTLDCIASGAQYSRVEKTARVARIAGAERWLNVCVDADGDGTNCSVCTKCCRTLFTLELLGELARFEKAFDLARWARVRTRYIRSGLLGDADVPFAQEIREHCKASGHRFGLSDRVAGEFFRLRRRLARA
jgi:hypothetical protein